MPSFCSRRRMYIKALVCKSVETNQRINSMLRTRSSSMILRLILHMNVLSSVASAFWRLPCYARLGVFRIDPIVSEGRPSQHAHTLHGGQSTYCVSVEDRCLTFSLDLGLSSSYDALLQSSCTTCAVLEDMSAY